MKADKGQTEYTVSRIYDDETGVLRMQQIRKNGLKHSPPDGEASHIAWDKHGQVAVMMWHEKGMSHREDGPSTIWFNPENGVRIVEAFKRAGEVLVHESEPHVVHRDKETGAVVEQRYRRPGRKRDDIVVKKLEP